MAQFKYYDPKSQKYIILDSSTVLKVPYDLTEEEIQRFTQAILGAIPNGDEMEY